MSGPFIFMTTVKIRPGRLEDYRQFVRELMAHIEAKEPQLIGFNMYLNADGSEMTSIQIHPDAASMEFHLEVMKQVVGEDMLEWVGRTDFIEPQRYDIFGTSSPAVLKSTQPFVDTGVSLNLKPVHMAGFIRSSAG